MKASIYTCWAGLIGFVGPFASANYGETFNVATCTEVAAAAVTAKPGDEIVLADGEYKNLEATLTSEGSNEQGIRLRARSPGQALITGTPKLKVTGKYIEIVGLDFRKCALAPGANALVTFSRSEHCRLTQCVFQDSSLREGTSVVRLEEAASDNEISENRFLRTRHRSIVIAVDDTSLESGPPARTRIIRNVFSDVPPLGGNGGETIQIGQRAKPYSNLRAETLIEDNEFTRCDGEAEVISLKTSGNIVRRNFFRDCQGEVVLRHGENNRVERNLFDGGLGGIRVTGSGHVITGNVVNNVSSTGIRLYYGTPDAMHPASYLPVTECEITDNILNNCAEMGLLIGGKKNATFTAQKWTQPPFHANAVLSLSIAPHGNRIARNIIAGKPGTLLFADEAPDNTLEENILAERTQPPADSHKNND